MPNGGLGRTDHDDRPVPSMGQRLDERLRVLDACANDSARVMNDLVDVVKALQAKVERLEARAFRAGAPEGG